MENMRHVIEMKTNMNTPYKVDLSNLEVCPYVRRLPTGRKCCAVMSCLKNARSKGDFCIQHGGGLRCAVSGCHKGARDNRGYCIKHGGGPRCLKLGCIKGAADRCGRYCVKHGKRFVATAAAAARRRKRKSRYNSDEDEDDDEEDNEYETLSSSIRNENVLEITRIKRQRRLYPSISSNESIKSDIISSKDSVTSLGDDVRNVFGVTEIKIENSDNDNSNINNTNNNNNNDNNNTNNTTNNNTNTTNNNNNHENRCEILSQSYSFTNNTNLETVSEARQVNSYPIIQDIDSPNLIQSSFPIQLQPVIKQKISLNFENYTPIVKDSSQMMLTNMRRPSVFNNYNSSSPNMTMMMNYPVYHSKPALNHMNNIMLFKEIPHISVERVYEPYPFAFNHRLTSRSNPSFLLFRMKQF